MTPPIERRDPLLTMAAAAASTVAPVRVRPATDADAAGWNALVDASDGVPPYCRYEWRHVLTGQFAADVQFHVAADANGAIAGILGAYVVRGGRGRKRVFTLHRGLLATSEAAERALVDCVAEIARAEGAVAAQFSAPGPVASARTAPVVKSALVLPVAATVDETWSALRAKTRNMIRKAQGFEFVAERGDHNLRGFYDLYAAHLLGLGVPIHRFGVFEEIARRFGRQSELIAARHNGVLVGGLYLFFGRSVAAYPFQATAPSHRKMAVTQFLIWEAVQCAVARGIGRIDMGESREGSPVYESKVNFGGAPQPVYYYDALAGAGAGAGAGVDAGGSSSAGSGRPSAAQKLDEILLHRSPMWLRRRYAFWKRRQGRLLF